MVSHRYGPVAKLEYLARLAGSPNLNRTDLAVAVVLADMARADTGKCWPGNKTLAARAGTSPRVAKRAISKLIETHVIHLARRGGGAFTNTNCYQINLRWGDPQDTGDSDDTGDSEVPKGCPTGTEGVSSRSPKSINQSEHKAKIDNRSPAAEAGASPAGAGSPRPGADRYPEFWAAVGHRSTVAAAEAIISQAVASGVEYQEIVAGAQRWAAYSEFTGSKRRSSPQAWLKREGWRDDWTLPNARPVEDRAAWDEDQWGREAAGLHNKRDDFWIELTDHVHSCDDCPIEVLVETGGEKEDRQAKYFNKDGTRLLVDAFRADRIDPSWGWLCPVGEKHYSNFACLDWRLFRLLTDDACPDSQVINSIASEVKP